MRKDAIASLRVALLCVLSAVQFYLLPSVISVTYADGSNASAAYPSLRLQQSSSPAAFAAATVPAPVEDQTADGTPLTRISIGDSVSMQVYGKPELSVSSEVADDGSYLVPLAGPVKIAGLSASQAATRIAQALSSGEFLVNPQVTVTIKETRGQQVSVLGEVTKPGRFPVTSNTTVFDLLALAGGATQESASVIYLIHKETDGRSRRIEINLTRMLGDNASLPEVKLVGGDTIFVPRASRFYVYGEVLAPGQFRLEQGMTVLQAITKAGGVTRRGSTSRIDVKRLTPDGNLGTSGAKLSDLVQPDDVIQVKESLF